MSEDGPTVGWGLFLERGRDWLVDVSERVPTVCVVLFSAPQPRPWIPSTPVSRLSTPDPDASTLKRSNPSVPCLLPSLYHHRLLHPLPDGPQIPPTPLPPLPTVLATRYGVPDAPNTIPTVPVSCSLHSKPPRSRHAGRSRRPKAS